MIVDINDGRLAKNLRIGDIVWNFRWHQMLLNHINGLHVAVRILVLVIWILVRVVNSGVIAVISQRLVSLRVKVLRVVLLVEGGLIIDETLVGVARVIGFALHHGILVSLLGFWR